MPITKSQYLENEDVKNFITWIISHMNGGLPHEYAILPRGRGKINSSWQCDSIISAFEKYNWKFSFIDLFQKEKKRIIGESFSDSSEVLYKFKNKLNSAINKNNDDEVEKVSFMILDWGGVLTNNDKKIKEIRREVNLCSYFKQVKELFTDNELTLNGQYFYKTRTGSEESIIMNSGFTKIYSMLINDFIIYDGRVGAALGLLVSRFMNGSEAPKDFLDFAWGPARKSTKCKNSDKRRNPSTDRNTFPKLSANSKIHIEHNIKANWLLNEVVNQSQLKNSNNPLRQIEAALFMIGSCVNCKCIP